ncbi:hypothetical protein BE221DRAFT_193734 [Ostreococcus tauri]|uniref:phosphoacetylglucosamine mutase n=1 Tax=Ostreococcus tauri TaxID=70448 RepID=A0A1Y5I868_OSTTA|nr:hypothetical protein BE221DRAFT_193734 [Ostreococcus tauri]
MTLPDASNHAWAQTYAKATRDHPLPTESDGGAPIQFSYGTAGFRTRAEILHSTCFRAGALAAARSLAHGGQTTGIVITASHNPARDNGVKLVEPNGGTMPMALESVAEALANASEADAEAQIAALGEAARMVDASAAAAARASDRKPRVFVARDTRASGRALADAALAGIRAMGVEAVDRGVATTPQLHYYVLATNTGAPDAEADYYARLAAGYAALTEKDEDDMTETENDTDNFPPLVIDCADGVGGDKLAGLSEAVESYGLRFDLRNRGNAADSSLNDGVGSDFVQKARTPPMRGGFESLEPGTRCVSVDGDADRLIYFETPRSPGEPIALVDGDQIAVLIADFLGEMVREAEPYLTDVRVGVVQTAYANGASTKFLTERLGEPPACVPTGVKHLHHKAEEMDIGVYFESNGHGTALFSPAASKAIEEATVEALTQRAMPQVKALLALTHAQRCINPAVGDAMSGILLVEAILRVRKIKGSIANLYYTDLSSRQTKVVVRDRTTIKTVDAERTCEKPPGLQEAIEKILDDEGREKVRGRAFVRPSGTEDCVRVYVEATDEATVGRVTDAIVEKVRDLCA